MYKGRFIRIEAIAALAAFALTEAGCTKSVPESNDVECSFRIGLEAEILSKADPLTPDPILADRCLMELFYGGESAGKYETPLVDGNAQFSVTVVAGRTYDIAFWADKTGLYETESLKAVGFPENGYDVANNSFDAFCGIMKDVTVAQTQLIRNITLKRPFAKVNVSNSGSQTMLFDAPGTYNVLEDTFGSLRAFSYSNPTFYIFASESKSTIDINVGTVACSSVPIQRNYLTNLIINTAL